MIWLLVVEEEIFIHTRSLSPSYSHNLPTCPNINKTSSGTLKYKHNCSVNKNNLAKVVQSTPHILDLYFEEITSTQALSDSHVNCPSSGDDIKPLALQT